MIPIIIISCIATVLYIPSIVTPWFLWNDSLLVGLSYDLQFKWTSATYKKSSFELTEKFEYTEKLKNSTFLPTLSLLCISYFFLVFGVVLGSIVFQFMKTKKQKRRTATYFLVTFLLHIVTLLTGFLYFISFKDNIKKERQFCGENTYFSQIIQDQYSYLYTSSDYPINTPIFCDGIFYQNSFRVDYRRGSVAPGAGYWLCLAIIILSLINFIIFLCRYHPQNYKDSKNHHSHTINKSDFIDEKSVRLQTITEPTIVVDVYGPPPGLVPKKPHEYDKEHHLYKSESDFVKPQEQQYQQQQYQQQPYQQQPYQPQPYQPQPYQPQPYQPPPPYVDYGLDTSVSKEEDYTHVNANQHNKNNINSVEEDSGNTYL